MRTKERKLNQALVVVADVVSNMFKSNMVRMDRFHLKDEDLGLEGKAEPITFRKKKDGTSYPLYNLRLASGRKLALPPYQVVNARVITKALPTSLSTLKDTTRCLIGDAYKVVNDNSESFHEYFGMEEGKEFFYPEKIKLVGALISSDRDGNPIPALFCYQGFSEYWNHCIDKGIKANIDGFKVELSKTGDDRLAVLPKGVKKPQLLPHLEGKLTPADYNFTLIFEDIED